MTTKLLKGAIGTHGRQYGFWELNTETRQMTLVVRPYCNPVDRFDNKPEPKIDYGSFESTISIPETYPDGHAIKLDWDEGNFFAEHMDAMRRYKMRGLVYDMITDMNLPEFLNFEYHELTD